MSISTRPGLRIFVTAITAIWAPATFAQQPTPAPTPTPPPVSVTQLSTVRDPQAPRTFDAPSPSFLQTTWVRVKPRFFSELSREFGGTWESEAFFQTSSSSAQWGSPSTPPAAGEIEFPGSNNPSPALDPTSSFADLQLIGSRLRRNTDSGQFTESCIELRPGQGFDSTLLHGLQLFSSGPFEIDAALGGSLRAQTQSIEDFSVASRLHASCAFDDSIRLNLGLRSTGESCTAFASLSVQLGERYSMSLDCLAGLFRPESQNDAFTKLGDQLYGNPGEGVTVQITLGSALF